MSKAFRSRGNAYRVDPDFLRALGEGDNATQGRHRRTGHKDLQLCRQVQRALMLALDGDLADLLIADVTPVAGCTRLLVQVVIPEGGTAQVLERLRERSGHLRAQVARSIHRKRAPELTFVAGFREIGS